MVTGAGRFTLQFHSISSASMYNEARDVLGFTDRVLRSMYLAGSLLCQGDGTETLRRRMRRWYEKARPGAMVLGFRAFRIKGYAGAVFLNSHFCEMVQL